VGADVEPRLAEPSWLTRAELDYLVEAVGNGFAGLTERSEASLSRSRSNGVSYDFFLSVSCWRLVFASMSAKKRTPAQREVDLVTLLKLLKRGVTHADAGAALGVTRQQIDYDWKQLLKRLQHEQSHKAEALRAGKLAEYAAIKAAAWDGWKRSQQPAEVLVVKMRELSGAPSAGQPSAAPAKCSESSKRSKGRSGDPRFLAVVRGCVESECALQGLVPPKKLRHESDSDTPPFKVYSGFDPDDV
jgi:hypothetical protein